MNEAMQVAAGHRVFVTDGLVETGYQKLLEGGDLVAQGVTLERRGGPCPLCGREFTRIDIDNAYGKFTYYQPACHCYGVCNEVRVPSGTTVGCGRHLVTERVVGLHYCTSCYKEPPGSKPAAERTRTGYRTGRKASVKETGK